MLQDRMRSDRVQDRSDEPPDESCANLDEEIAEFASQLRRGDPERLAIFMGGIRSDEVARAIYDLYDGTQLEEWFFERRYGGIDEAARSLVTARRRLEQFAPMQWAIDATSLILWPHGGNWTDVEVRWNHNRQNWEAAVRTASNAQTAQASDDPVAALEHVLSHFEGELEVIDRLTRIREMIETTRT